MKKLLIAIMISIIVGGASAQVSQPMVQQTYWPVVFDAYWQVVQVPLAPSYYRDFKPFPDGRAGGNIRDYFVSGKLQMEGRTSSNISLAKPDEYVKEGMFTWYFENGVVSIISFFRNNQLDGFRSVFYEDGTINEESFYKAGKLDGDYKSYYKNGKLWFNAKYINGMLVDNFVEEYSESGERATVYVENFVTASNNYNWQLGDFDTYSAKIEPSTGLKMTDSDNERMGFHVVKPSILSGTPFSFGCRVSSQSGLKGANYGLTFDFIDWDNYKYYLISDNGNFSVGQFSNGNKSFIVSLTTTEAVSKLKSLGEYIYDNVNNLEIENQDGKTTFKVNQKIVYSSPQVLFTGKGMLGLYIESGNKSVTFNQFIIKSK